MVEYTPTIINVIVVHDPFHHQATLAMIIYTHPIADNLPIKSLVAR